MTPLAIDASRDGQALVLGDDRGDITVLAINSETFTATPVRRWHAHDGQVLVVVCEPGGLRVVSAGSDGALRAWELESGARCDERRIESVIDRVLAVADAALLRVTTRRLHTTRTPWDEQIDSVVYETEIYSTAAGLKCLRWGADAREIFSPDGRWSMDCADAAPTLYDLRADKAPAVGMAPGLASRAAAMVGGDTPVALVPKGDRIERWSFLEATEAHPLTRCTELRFLTPEILVSAHRDAAPFVRDGATGSPRGSVGQESWKLRDLYLAASKRHAVHSEYGEHLLHLKHTVVDLAAVRSMRKVPARGNDRHVALTRGRDRFIVVDRHASRTRLEVRDLVSNDLLLERDLRGYDRAWVLPGEPQRLALCTAAYSDEPLVVWDVAAATAVAEIAGPTLAVRRMCANHDGTRVLTHCPPALSASGPTQAVVFWNVVTQTSHVLEGHAMRPTCVAFAVDPRYALSADPSTVIAWDLETLRPRWTLPLPSGLAVPEGLHALGSELVLIERGLFGPHLVARLDDGVCVGSFEGARVAPARTTAGAILVGVVERGELVLYEDSSCAPFARWRGVVDATAWTQSGEPPYTIAVGDERGDVTLLTFES